MKGVLAAALLVAGATEASATQATTTFRLAGVEFEVPLPDGYCLPRGVQADVAQLLAAGDPDNVTHLTLFPCEAREGGSTEHILVKTPRELLLANVEREQLLAELGDVFEGTELTALLASEEFLNQAVEPLTSVLGQRITLVGEIRPLGRDDVCAYMGGTMQVSSPAESQSASVGLCVTAVSGRVLSVNWYGPDRGSTGVAELLMRARRFAESISGRPGS